VLFLVAHIYVGFQGWEEVIREIINFAFRDTIIRIFTVQGKFSTLMPNLQWNIGCVCTNFTYSRRWPNSSVRFYLVNPNTHSICSFVFGCVKQKYTSLVRRLISETTFPDSWLDYCILIPGSNSFQSANVWIFISDKQQEICSFWYMCLFFWPYNQRLWAFIRLEYWYLTFMGFCV